MYKMASNVRDEVVWCQPVAGAAAALVGLRQRAEEPSPVAFQPGNDVRPDRSMSTGCETDRWNAGCTGLNTTPAQHP